MSEPCARLETIELAAAAAEDERQLDGRRYLELVGEHPERAIEAALRLVISRDGVIDEAELIVTDTDASTAMLLDTPANADELEPLELRLSSGAADLEVMQADDGDYALRITLAQPIIDTEAAP